MNRKLLFILSAMTLLLSANSTFAMYEIIPIRVACVGDSITAGEKVSKKESFPEQLDRMLARDYEVKSFAKSEATLLKEGDKPIWKQKEFTKAQEFQPNIVVINLGTFDSKERNEKHLKDFERDYVELVKIFQALESRPKVWLCYPAPAFNTKNDIHGKTIQDTIIPAIQKVAKKTGAKIIDLHTPLAGKPDLMVDGIYPNDTGSKIIAETIHDALTGMTTQVKSQASIKK